MIRFQSGKYGKRSGFSYDVTDVTNVRSCYKLLQCSYCPQCY